MNPNNNMNAYDQALRINRELKRENDSLVESNNKLNEIVSNFLDRMNVLENENDGLRNVLKEVDEYILHYVVYNIDSAEEDRQLGRIQQLIREVL